MPRVTLWIVNGCPPLSAHWRRLCEQQADWEVRVDASVSGLLARLEERERGLALLDWSCLQPSPQALLQALRRSAPELALIVTSEAELASDRVIELLEAGVDDYFRQSIAPQLVLAKVRAHARRLAPTQAPALVRAPCGDLKMDLAKRDVWLRQSGKWSSRSDLTTTQLQLLALLLERPGVAVERRLILERLRSGKTDTMRPGTVDKHVEALRRKLGRFGARICTVYGVGYVYRE